jgi:hypothetical protein
MFEIYGVTDGYYYGVWSGSTPGQALSNMRNQRTNGHSLPPELSYYTIQPAKLRCNTATSNMAATK